MDLAQARQRLPELQGLDDDAAVDAIHQAFYPDRPRDDVAKALGVAPPPAPEPKRSWGDVAADTGISLVKGAMAVPEAAVGLGDIVSGGAVGKAAEAVGFRPDEAGKILDTGYSEKTKQAFQDVQQAEGLWDTIKAVARNPATTIGHTTLQSLPSMLAGGAVSRGALRVMGGMGIPVTPGSAAWAAGIGEGAVQTGQAAEQARQEDPQGELTGRAGGAAIASGGIDAVIARFSGNLANRLGIVDPDEWGATGKMIQAAAANPRAEKMLARKVLEGMFVEGMLEELPQSIQEQVWQNHASGKPLDEGVPQAAVLGTLSGMVMGGGANLLSGLAKKEAVASPPPPAAPTPPAVPPTEVMNAPSVDAAIAAAGAALHKPGETLTGTPVGDLMGKPGMGADAAVQDAMLGNARRVEEDQRQDALADQAVEGMRRDANRDLGMLRDHESLTLPRKQPTEPALPSLDEAIQPGDLIQKTGAPYPEKAAKLKLKMLKQGGTLVQVEGGGYIVRPNKEAINEDQSRDAGNTVGQPPAVQTPAAPAAQPAPVREGGTDTGLLANAPANDEAVPGDAAAAPVAGPGAAEARAGGVEPQTAPAPVTQTQETTNAPAEAIAPAPAPAAPAPAPAPVATGEGAGPVVAGDGAHVQAPAAEPASAPAPDVERTALGQERGEHVETTTLPNGKKPVPLAEVKVHKFADGKFRAGAHFMVEGGGSSGGPWHGTPFDTADDAKRDAIDKIRAQARSVIEKKGAWRDASDTDVARAKQVLVWALKHRPRTAATADINTEGGDEAATNKVPASDVAVAPAPPDVGAPAPASDEVPARPADEVTQPRDDETGQFVKASEQFESYRKHIEAANGVISAGLHQQIEMDERLNDGEAEKLLATGREAAPGTRVTNPDGSYYTQPDPAKDEKAAKAAARKAEREAKAAVREKERELFSSMGADSSLDGKGVPEIEAAVREQLGDVKLDDERVKKLAEGIHKQLAKTKAERDKEKNRDPALLQAAIRASMPPAGSRGELLDTPEKEGAYGAGFMHAMKGKTKSTLSGENLASMQAGYEAGMRWRDTEEGAAFYEGRPVAKLQNTGVDLRRYWDAMAAQMKAGESDVQKAWKQIERATSRSDLFAPLMPDSATPGFKLYVMQARQHVFPFKEWLDKRAAYWQGSYKSRYDKGGKSDIDYIIEGRRYPNDGNDEKFRDDEEFRAEWLREAAQTYIAHVRAFASVFEGKSSVQEAAKAFDEKYLKTDEHGRISANDVAKKILYRDGDNRRPAIWDGYERDFTDLGSDSRFTKNLIANEATAKLPDRKQPLVHPKLDRIERKELPDHRKGRNVTPQEFKDTFGFADVGFGTYVRSKQDQDHLNYAYDALMDMAQLVGMEPKNIGFGGLLHFTIGALGHGSKAAAHFHASQPSPDGPVQVINLTNTKGDGTVHHEWTHALDHNLGGEWKSKVRPLLQQYINYTIDTAAQVERYAQRFLTGGSYWSGNKRGDKVDAAIKGIEYYSGTGRSRNSYKVNADKLGADYWGNEHEMLARASEAWAVDTLNPKINNYLVNPSWAGDSKVTSANYRGTPYPQGEERKLINGVIGAMIKAVKWKDGKPSITLEDFKAALPDEVTEGERRRDELKKRENMEQFYDELTQKKAAEAAAAEAEAREAERIERERDESMIASKLAELEAHVDPPMPDETTGPLEASDLDAIFDQAAAEVREETQEQPDVAPPPVPSEEPEPKMPAAEDLRYDAKTGVIGDAEPPGNKVAGELIAEAAKLGVKGAGEALSGLAKLFGSGPGKLSSFPGGFDEETYQQAKPHFQAALEAFQQAGRTLKDLFKLLIQQFGDGIKPYAVRFAKDMNLTATLGTSAAPEERADERSPSAKLAADVARHLAKGGEISWRALFSMADAHFGGTQADGKYTVKDAYDALEAGVNLYLMSEQGRAFNPSSDRETALMTLGALDRVVALLPTQTKRTDEQEAYQQFSTIPTLAFLANWAANVQPGDTVLEPSAGVGGLAVFAKNAGANLILNELSSRRAAVLAELFPSVKVWAEDAAQLNNILPPSYTPSVVVMNPPFSNNAATGIKKDTAVGAQHVKQALLRLADRGRLVAIVGEGMAMDKPAFAGWWRDIKTQYDVRAVVPLSGASYAKYGTTFDNVLIVIDKQAPQGRDVITKRLENYVDLIPLLSEVRDERLATTVPANDRDRIEQDAAEQARADALPAREGDAGAGPAGGGAAVLGEGQPAGRGPGVAGGGGRSGGGGGAGKSGRDVSQSGRPGTGAGDNAQAGGGNSGEQPRGPESGLTVQAGEAPAAQGELTESVFEGYQPKYVRVDGAKPHPGALVESAAMATVLPPRPTYTPNLPAKTITEGKLSLPQIEAVLYAGQAHQEFLPKISDAEKPTRRGFFIGDGTGVGKGREIGAIILDNIRQGRKKHVWVSEKQGLMKDAQRDFEGIGGDPKILFNQNKTKAENDIEGKSGILFTTYSTLRSGAMSQAATGTPMTGAQLAKAYPPGTKVTYKRHEYSNATHEGYVHKWGRDKVEIGYSPPDGSRWTHATKYDMARIVSIGDNEDWRDAKHLPQTGKEKKEGQSRLDQLVKWVGEDFDGVIAFDEAHNGGNAVPMKGERGSSKPSAQALAMVDIQKKLPNARVVYVSATGATQVSNLSYATRLGLWGPQTSFSSVHEFISQMTAGGLATMELVARDMKQMGVYLARSLSYDGVTYSRVEHELTDIQRDIYNRLADAWQVTLQNFTKALEVTGGENSGKAKSAAASAYWGAQQRFFNQVITSMQMPTVLDQIEADMKQGDAIVLQLVNTNEAQQERALAARKDDDEGAQDLEDLDLTPRDQLLQMVEKSFPVVQYEEFEEDGKTQHRPVMDAGGNPVLNREAVAMREKLLQDLREIKVPDGPLELILNQFGPDVVAEVTGRKQRVVRKPDADGKVKAQLESRGSSSAQADADSFMADKKRILVFSDAGGTGYSFHADLTKKNQRKRKHYLLQPGWRADKAVQGMGRSHRSNEASQPHYYLASTDIPAQKRFLSAIARRLDQLGALTKGERKTANQGLFSEKDNLEGKYATSAVRQFFDDAKRGALKDILFLDLLRQMGLENIVNEETGQIPEDKYPSTRLFLNRMLSLHLDMQAKVFNAFAAIMDEKVEQAIQRNELDTGLQTIKALSARIKNEQVVYTDPKTGAETRYVELELEQPTRIFSFPTEETEHRAVEYFHNAKSGKVWARMKSSDVTLKNGNVVTGYTARGTGGSKYKQQAKDFIGPDWEKIEQPRARELWAEENTKKPATYKSEAHMIVGALLPIWDRLDTSSQLRVARTQTVDGRRLLGRVIEAKDVADIKKRLNVASTVSKLPPAEVMRRILKGEVGELTNGWTMERARVSDDLRIELKTGYLSRGQRDELDAIGAMFERIGWQDRAFIPTGAAGVPVLEKLFASKPLVELNDPNAKTEPGEGEEPMMAQGPASSGGLMTSAVQAHADAIAAQWKNGPRNIVIVRTPESAPRAVAEEAGRREAAGGGLVKATIYGNTVYLFSDRIANLEEATVFLYHEVLGHDGMHGHFGEELDRELMNIVRLRKSDIAAMYERTGVKEKNEANDIHMAEEVVAYMAQTQPELGLVKRVISAIRNFLRDHVPGFKGLELTDNDIIQKFILPARQHIEGGGPDGGGGMQPEAVAAAQGFNTREVQVQGKWRPIANALGRLLIPDHDPAKLQAFWRWFGDSKVVDEEGKPLVVYHGTYSDIDSFNIGNEGVFFSASPTAASNYASFGDASGGNVVSAYLALKNPLIVTDPDPSRKIGANYYDMMQGELGKRARVEGRDGIIIKSMKGRKDQSMYVAFHPEQIKSAIGNNGGYDGGNQDIRFGQGDAAGPRAAFGRAQEFLWDTIDAPGTMRWWNKALSTPYHVAQKYPKLRPVFERVQAFLNDTNLYANEAADAARTILPKIDSWRDVLPAALGGSGKKPLAAADNKALAAPVLEGTLKWTRDANGKPINVEKLRQQAEGMSTEQKARAMFKSGAISEKVLKMWQGMPIEQYEKAVNTRFQSEMIEGAGIVWTDDELKSMFGLDARQIGLYREFRAATDKSITQLAVSDMLRYLGDDGDAVRDDVLAATSVQEAASILTAQLQDMADAEPERADVLSKSSEVIERKAELAQSLMDRGYAPLSRFGHYTVTIWNDSEEDGGKPEVLFFGMYESPSAAGKAARALQASGEFEGARMTRGTISHEEYRLFAGIDPDTAELFGRFLGLETTTGEPADLAFQEFLKRTRSSRSAMKRLIHRKGIAGFSEDMPRVLASLIYSNARQTSRNLHDLEVTRMAADIAKEEGELKDYAVKLAEYVKRPMEEAHQLKGLLFAQYLGGSIAAAMVNMTQPFMMTLPYLSQWGAKEATANFKWALANAWNKSFEDKQLERDMQKRIEDGTIAPHEVHQLIAQAHGRGELVSGDGTTMGDAIAMANNQLTKLQVGWGKFFSTAELFNRRVTYVAAWRLANSQGMADPDAFAKQAVDETQGIYNKGNRMPVGRGAVGGLLMTFKQYSIAYLEFVSRMWNAGEPGSPERAAGRRAVYFAMLMVLLMGGGGGLPFEDDAADVVDAVMQRLGYNWQTKQKRQELFESAFGRGLGHFLEKGVSGLPGVPIDVAGRLGLGNLIPGTGLLTKKSDHTQDVIELGGPAAALAKSYFGAANAAADGRLFEAGLMASPTAASNLAKAIDMASSGIYKDGRGYKVLDVDGFDALSKAIGFQPQAVARVQEADRAAQQMVSFTRLTQGEISARWAQAIVDGDADTQRAVRESIADYNEKNPEAPIKVKFADVLKRVRKMREDRSTRIENASPKGVRAEVRRLTRDEE